jgi:hypothetical protein
MGHACKILKRKQKNYRRAEEGILNPLVIKSPLFLPSLVSFVKRLSKLSLRPIILRRFFFSFSSFNTRAVSEAVAAFLMPFPLVPGVGVAFLISASVESSAVACFLRFFEPGAFFREWVRPCSASLAPRAIRRCLSSSLVGRIAITLSSE